MALIKCEQCGQYFWHKADACHECGWVPSESERERAEIDYRREQAAIAREEEQRRRSAAQRREENDTRSPSDKELHISRMPHPWRRYFARMLDYATVGLIPLFILHLLVAKFAPQGVDRLSLLMSNLVAAGIIHSAIWIPVEAALIALTGRTPGKSLYGIKIVDEQGNKLSFRASLKRSALVWVQGLGLGIPIVALFTQLAAHKRLGQTGSTLWDNAVEAKVTHENWGVVRGVFVVVITLAAVHVHAMAWNQDYLSRAVQRWGRLSRAVQRWGRLRSRNGRDQTARPVRPGWRRVSIPGVGTIDVPPSMEVQKDDSAIGMLKSGAMDDQPQVVIQQRGLNDQEERARGTYVRILVSTENGAPGQYSRLDEIHSLTQAELTELSDGARKHIIDENRGMQQQLRDSVRKRFEGMSREEFKAVFGPALRGREQSVDAMTHVEFRELLLTVRQAAVKGVGSFRLLRWWPAVIEQAGAQVGVRLQYRRQMGDNPPGDCPGLPVPQL
ncbi:MAG: RDD family protein [bacterium]